MTCFAANYIIKRRGKISLSTVSMFLHISSVLKAVILDFTSIRRAA